MSTQTTNKDEDLIVLNDDSQVVFDISPNLSLEESKIDENIILFDEIDSKEESKNEVSFKVGDEKDNIDTENSFDLGASLQENTENIQEITETNKIEDEVSFDLFSENKDEKVIEKSNDVSFDLDSDKKENVDSSFDMFGGDIKDNKKDEIQKISLDNILNRNSILDEAILKLEKRKENINDIRIQKYNIKTDLLSKIELLKTQVSDIDNEIEDLDEEITSIDSDIDSIKSLLEIQESKNKRKHDSKKVKIN